MTSRDPKGVVRQYVRSAILATAWLLVFNSNTEKLCTCQNASVGPPTSVGLLATRGDLVMVDMLWMTSSDAVVRLVLLETALLIRLCCN